MKRGRRPNGRDKVNRAVGYGCYHSACTPYWREIILSQSAAPQDARPIRAETRATLVASIARGRCWLDEIVAGTVTVDQIAVREQCSIRQVNMTMSLAFLAPRLVQGAVEGRLPRGIGVTRLRDAPAEWSRQYAMLGLWFDPRRCS